MNRADLRTALYVDDEPDIRLIVDLALGLVDGLAVYTCESGDQALALMPGLRPDIVLLDVMMPAVDGPTTLGLMHAHPAMKNIPVIFVTAKAMPKEIALFRALGAIGVIAKPFDPMQLGRQVVNLWEQHSR